MQDARQVGSDVELQELWLEAAASRDPGARVALEVHRQVEFARQPAWQAAVSGGDALAVARTLTRDLEKLEGERRVQLTPAILGGLSEVPAAAAAAGWKVQDPSGCLQKILADPAIAPARLARESLPPPPRAAPATCRRSPTAFPR